MTYSKTEREPDQPMTDKEFIVLRTFKTFLLTDVLYTAVDFALSCLLYCCSFVLTFIHWVNCYKGS